MGYLGVLIIGLIPASAIKNHALRRLGHKVHRSAKIGPVLILRVGRLDIAEGARVGPFNVLRDLRSVGLGKDSVIGQWNWISAAPSISGSGGGYISIGEQSSLTSRHYVDASGGVSIGHHTTVAGVRSTIITHGIDWRTSRQRTKPVTVGNYCIVGSNCSIAPGAVIPDKCVVGMGSVVAGSPAEAHSLVISPRAAAVRSNLDGIYFERERGYVS